MSRCIPNGLRELSGNLFNPLDFKHLVRTRLLGLKTRTSNQIPLKPSEVLIN